ncbi:MAG: hypothetical protein K6T83_15810 [Alicyclobacillus sp.]|nr:hypothetical protein [Alicyclobacillus sp.]
MTLIVHWYAFPTPASDDQLLASTDNIPSMASEVEQEIRQYCGANAKHVKVFVTETNSAANGLNAQSTSIVNALFLANDFMGWLSNGVANVDWWDLHNYGSVDQGDFGILDSLENKYPTYYALAMLHLFARPKDQLLHVSSNQPSVHAYAVHRWDGAENLLLVNTDPKRAFRVKLAVPNIGKQTGTVYTYGAHSTRIAASKLAVSGSVFSQTIQPYSITVITLKQSK